MGAFPTLGYRDIHGNLGLETSEIVRELYVDNWTDLEVMLNVLLGTPNGDSPSGTYTPHVMPYPFAQFKCADVMFQPIKDGAVQGSMTDAITNSNLTAFIDQLENIKGGFKVTATYRPMELTTYVTEEGFDFSGQVMSIISNAWAQDKDHALTWENGTVASNLKSMTKIIPKVELLQKRVYLDHAPGDDTTNLIGSVNNVPFTIMQQDQTSQRLWGAETLLLMAMPTVRRWRWDGRPMWEVTLRMAANTFTDVIFDGTTDEVTWNRLYNIYETLGARWERLKLPDGSPIYRLDDWSPLYLI